MHGGLEVPWPPGKLGLTAPNHAALVLHVTTSGKAPSSLLSSSGAPTATPTPVSECQLPVPLPPAWAALLGAGTVSEPSPHPGAEAWLLQPPLPQQPGHSSGQLGGLSGAHRVRS